MAASSKFSPAERRNWGFWDGKADAAKGRYPQWCKYGADMRKAHFDKSYAAGYYAGWYGHEHPNGKAA